MIITGSTKIKDAFEEHPELKELMVGLSPKFERLNNDFIYKTVSKFATFNDVAKIGKISICEILHKLNEELGTEEELLKVFPDCIKEINGIKKVPENDNIPNFTQIIEFDTSERSDFFFPEIMQKLTELNSSSALKVISKFDPVPLKKMIEAVHYSQITKEINEELFEIYIYRSKNNVEVKEAIKSDKVSVVLQSATPIAYPIILKMLESEKLMEKIEIEELKVWRETEKHLSWIVSGKADISFSALMSSAKIFNTKKIVMPAIVVWDNFKLLTKGYEAKNFSDVKGHEIYTPLFKGAPPFVLTKYLIRLEGNNPDDFNFKFGKPFGRPDEIKDSLVSGESDTVILREPEASFALFEGGEDTHVSIEYGEAWSKHHPELKELPNAGLLFKGEFVEKHPEIAALFMDELEFATNWVNGNIKEAAEMSAEKMGVSVEEAEFFIKRATLKYVKSTDVEPKLKAYLQLLKDEKILENQDVERTMGMFKIKTNELRIKTNL